MKTPLDKRLESLVWSPLPLLDIIEKMRELQQEGYTRAEVYQALEAMRAQTTNEDQEDRILEVMDFVGDFCPPERRIWSE